MRPRLLVRALSSPSDENWESHPLRKHALAEAHSLLSEGIYRRLAAGLKLGLGALDPISLHKTSIGLYREVADSTDFRRTTTELRASALNNIGNSYWYKGAYSEALDAWKAVAKAYPDHRNSGTLANMIAALVVLGDYGEATKLGAEAQEWAEENGKALQDTAHFVSILVNTGFAYIGDSKLYDASKYFELASMIEDDTNTKLNLALVYAMSNQTDQSSAILRSVSAPVSYKDGPKAAETSPDQRCSHLIWAIYSPEIDPRDAATRLFIFLGEKHSSNELEAFADKSQLKALRKRVGKWLVNFPGSCSSFGLIPPIVEFVSGNSLETIPPIYSSGRSGNKQQ